MANDPNRSIQVLNISNVNSLGKTVLNDGKLLDLIQKYPFLYNPRVRAYNDADYTAWAWKNINAAFNRSYAYDPKAAFSTGELMNRWQVLKPLIQCLSKAYDLDAIPEYLRKSVMKISTELEDQSSNVMTKPYNITQNLLMHHICDIAQLPLDKRLALEREMLDFILSSELEIKCSNTLDIKAWNEIDQDTEEFLSDIGFKEVLLTSVNQQQKLLFNNNNINMPGIKTNLKNKRTRGWVPLKDAHKFITPCEVRVKRMNVEDYLPLAKMIKIKKVKLKREYQYSEPESTEILGI